MRAKTTALLLADLGPADETFRKEPPKATVLAWRNGGPLPPVLVRFGSV